jgi:hypothetical protein
MKPGPCPICDGNLVEIFQAVVLNRHSAVYDHCGACGFLRARSPYWLDEAYADSIAITDTGLLMRNQLIARQLSAVCRVLGADGPYLDFAGGYGVLVRLMRDAGLDFWWSDKFSRNLLAPGFEYRAEIGPCRAVTAFEVLEHVEDPRAFIGEALASGGSDTLIFSTQLYAGAPPAPADWWYYAFETGQHIGFYRRDTLERLASVCGLNFHTCRGMHFFSRQPLPVRRINLALGALNPLLAFVARRLRTTKTIADHDLMATRLASAAANEAANARRL